jgi:CRISPR-associated protein Csm1
VKGGGVLIRDTLYIGALLHDIGKFTERSKSYPAGDKFQVINKGHPKYSAQLLDILMKKNSFFKQFSEDLIELVLYHHQPRNHKEKIIQLADWLSSSERESGDTKEIYFSVPLSPVFTRLFGKENEELGYNLQELSFTAMFPQENPHINTHKYKVLVDSFFNELSLVQNETQLLYLLEKYLWCVPAQTTNYVPDISLYDHAKTTACIALCLFDQYEAGDLTQADFQEMDNSKKDQFILISGDVSGIQDFIFNIPSKGAAKSLKGHSVYLSLLSDVLTRFLIRELNLKEINVLYNGGGNFYILAPKSKEEKFLALKSEISKLLLNIHGGSIYVALDYISLCPADFEKFNVQWKRVGDKIDNQKRKKWSEIGLKENYSLLFGPFSSGSKEKEYCRLCGIEKEKRKIKYDPESEISRCSFCASFEKLTNSIKKADCLVVKESKGHVDKIEVYQDAFRLFGYEYNFCSAKEMSVNDFKQAYLLNDTNFLQKGYQGYRLGALKLPLKNEGTGLTFKEIAEGSQGDAKLALLKLDIDNLGYLFSDGFGKNATISRVTALSRMLGLYFEGYINHLITENQWGNYLYVVFSGGDDTFVIGAWDKVMEFVQKFYDQFKEFTGGADSVITFSAGICIFNYDYPLIMSSQLTEEALDKAKNFLEEGEDLPQKNKTCLFGEVFNWEEFKRIKEFKNLLLRIIETNSNKKGDFGRAFLFRIGKTVLGFKKILEDSLQGKVDNLRFWRLAYYLRDISRKDAEELIGQYREIVVNNLIQKSRDKKIGNIMIVPAAVKWAQMETRKRGEGENER